MTSPFVAQARELLAPAFAHHAQLYDWSPMMAAADVNAPPLPDPSRQAGELRGCYFDKEARPLIVNSFDPRTDQRPGTQSGTPRIEFPPFGACPAPDVRRRDVLLSKDGNRWRVYAVMTTKTGIRVAHVNAL